MKRTMNKEKQGDGGVGSFFVFEEPTVVIVDRSELERFAECPARGYLMRRKLAPSDKFCTNSGEEAHRAFSAATSEWINSQANLSPSEAARVLEQEARVSRPDVQPDVLRACRWCGWEWGRFITSIHPDNVLRFDGGEELNRSGQLAWDIPVGNEAVRVTSEVDLLYAGKAKALLHEVDYKSGYKQWTAAMVADAFQFQLHALLVFENYEEADGLEVTIWNTRSNRRTYSVEFQRKHLADYEARVRNAAAAWAQYRDDENAPAWPAAEKCGFCDAAAICPAIERFPQKKIEENPGAWVEQMLALDARLSEMQKAAAAHVAKTGKDIIATSGAAFGYQKPKANRRPSAALYTVSTESEESE